MLNIYLAHIENAFKPISAATAAPLTSAPSKPPAGRLRAIWRTAMPFANPFRIDRLPHAAAVFCALVGSAAPSLALDRFGENVLSGRPHVLRYFYNCRGPVGEVGAVAETGVARVERSTRFVCGQAKREVLQVVYQSPPDYRGPDNVKVFSNRKLDAVVDLHVGDDRTAPLAQAEPQVETIKIAKGQEHILMWMWNCHGGRIAPPLVDVKSGDVAIRDGVFNACGSPRTPAKALVYRAAPNFVGEDHVIIYSAFAPPYFKTIVVRDGEDQARP